jgi:hypothetical protein
MKRSFLSLVLSLAMGGFAMAATSKISPDLQNLDPNSKVRVIVQYAQPPSAQSGGGLLGGVQNLTGGLVNGVVNSLPKGGLLGGVLMPSSTRCPRRRFPRWPTIRM